MAGWGTQDHKLKNSIREDFFNDSDKPIDLKDNLHRGCLSWNPEYYPDDDSDDWKSPITYPSTTSGSGFTYMISWNETKYDADNNTGWEATKSNDDAETKTVYDWNGSAWA